jgi:predicted transcriptional regulator
MNHTKRPAVTLTARIPADLKKAIEQRAKRDERTVSALVRRALALYLRQSAA